MIYKYIGNTISVSNRVNPYSFTKNKLYKRVKDKTYPGYKNPELHQCIVDNKDQYVVMMKTSVLEKNFELSRHIFNRFYKLKNIFL